MTKIRSFSAILIEADKAKDLISIQNLWLELKENKYAYPLSQFRFGYEHLNDLASIIIQRELKAARILLKHINRL